MLHELVRARIGPELHLQQQQTELGQEHVWCKSSVRAAGVEPAALGHVHAQRDAEEQQCDGDGGGERQQSRTELGWVDEQVLQDGEGQQECDGGGYDEEHEKQEQPSSGAEVREHGGDAAAHGSPLLSLES